jgi:hypothetical protein
MNASIMSTSANIWAVIAALVRASDTCRRWREARVSTIGRIERSVGSRSMVAWGRQDSSGDQQRGENSASIAVHHPHARNPRGGGGITHHSGAGRAAVSMGRRWQHHTHTHHTERETTQGREVNVPGPSSGRLVRNHRSRWQPTGPRWSWRRWWSPMVSPPRI